MPDDTTTDVAPAMPRRFARPFLLLALERAVRCHGYELYEALSGLGVNVDLAGVYRELRTMEQHDLVTSTWCPSDAGPDRRVYALTLDGEASAIDARDEMGRVRDQLTAGLEHLASPSSEELGR